MMQVCFGFWVLECKEPVLSCLASSYFLSITKGWTKPNKGDSEASWTGPEALFSRFWKHIFPMSYSKNTQLILLFMHKVAKYYVSGNCARPPEFLKFILIFCKLRWTGPEALCSSFWQHQHVFPLNAGDNYFNFSQAYCSCLSHSWRNKTSSLLDIGRQVHNGTNVF